MNCGRLSGDEFGGMGEREVVKRVCEIFFLAGPDKKCKKIFYIFRETSREAREKKKSWSLLPKKAKLRLEVG